MVNSYKSVSAIEDFEDARKRAALKEILARFTGESTQLLPFDEVREKLRAREASQKGLQEIPLDAIVGSVGRYTEFTRDFLPTDKVSSERWLRVRMAATNAAGLPPIEVYQIGDVYFVKDGNHRVSVARELGAPMIQAYVTEVRSRVPLTPDVTPDELILKSEYAEFLEKTNLDKLRPEADLTLTAPGKYDDLLEHIAVHHYFMGLDLKRDVSWEEAVAHWYDAVYAPVAEMILDRGIMRFFPKRTEADLYLWLAEHRAAVSKELGWQVPAETAAGDLVKRYGDQAGPMPVRLGSKLVDALTLAMMAAGPPAGEWRREFVETRQDERLFREILVPVNGQASGWFALEQALVVAEREGAFLHGLHVVQNEAQKESDAARSVRSEFNLRCAQAGVGGELVFGIGPVSPMICDRARWTDLVVTSMAYPPGKQPLERLSSGFRLLLQRCPRPVLVTPQATSPLSRALLAYDGSPKSREALFVAAYIAASWNFPLVVTSVVGEGLVSAQTLEAARVYLDSHQVRAEYVPVKGKDVAKAVLKVCTERQCNFILMGGYGFNPMLEAVLGSAVDQVLRESHLPMLICR